MARSRHSNRFASPANVFGTSPHNALSVPLSVVIGIMLSASAVSNAVAGDILRGGAPGGAAPSGRRSSAAQADSIASQAAANANDALVRTTRAVDSVRAMQASARSLALKGGNALGATSAGRVLPKVVVS